MSHDPATAVWSPQQSRFEFAPPRHFLFPAILLLLSEKPGYGYSLVKDLQDIRFGPVERAAVYRVLGQLENDGLVASWDEPAKAGQGRKVYGVTEFGSRVLRYWMGVVKEERDCLNNVLHRYQSTGTADAALAQADGLLRGALGTAWSPVSSTCATGRLRPPSDVAAVVLTSVRTTTPRGESSSASCPVPEPESVRHRYRVIPDRSVILIEARSTVGPLRFGASGLTGDIEVALKGDAIDADASPTAVLTVPVNQLRSGNGLYDAELLRRIDARRFPRVTVALEGCTPVGTADRYRAMAEVMWHGATRRIHGTAAVKVLSRDKLVVTGDHALDVRDFHLPSPTVLMLRIYPDVRINVHLEAELVDSTV